MDSYTLALQISYNNAMKENRKLREEIRKLKDELLTYMRK